MFIPPALASLVNAHSPLAGLTSSGPGHSHRAGVPAEGTVL